MAGQEEIVARQKQKLISRARSVVYGGDLWKGHTELQSLQQEWGRLGFVGADFEGNNLDSILWSRFAGVAEDFFSQRDREIEAATFERRSLLRAMKLLASSTPDRKSGEKANDLLRQWKSLPPLPQDREKQLGLLDQFMTLKRGLEERTRRDTALERSRAELEFKATRLRDQLRNLDAELHRTQVQASSPDREVPISNVRYYRLMEQRREEERQKSGKLSKLGTRMSELRIEIFDLENRIENLR